MYADLFHIKAALDTDVQGYVSKKSPLSELSSAILSVAGGGTYFCRESATVVRRAVTDKEAAKSVPTEMEALFQNYRELSKSEKELFLLLAQRKDIAEIAQSIGKSEKTVLNKRTILRQKLCLRDRLDLVEAARMLGVIA